MDTKSLIEITKTLHEFELAIIENGGEIPPELEAQISSETILKEKKIDAYHSILERCKLTEAQILNKVNILKALGKGYGNLASRLKDNLKFAMKSTDTKELAGEMMRFIITRPTSIVEIFNPEILPDNYKIQVTKLIPNNEKISIDLKNGIFIPGAQLVDSFQLRSYPKQV